MSGLSYFHRLPSRLFIAVCCGWLISVWSCAVAAPRILPASPDPYYIKDEVRWLSPSVFRSLDEKLKSYERETSSQVLVAILPSVPPGEELFDYCQRIFEAWKPGVKQKDNGVILFIFPQGEEGLRKIRIHTGYGLEGALPDARCNQIINQEIIPRLKARKFEEAVLAGTDAIMAAVKGEYVGIGETQTGPSSESDGLGFGLFIFFVTIFVVTFVSKLRGGSVVYGSGGTRTFNGGGWSGGGGGSSWGGGGGGFSGGGGSSGGGGASGSW